MRFLLLFVLALLVQAADTVLLPNGRVITPAGHWITTAPYPFTAALQPGGDQITVPSIGFPFALNVIRNVSTGSPAVTRIPPGDENHRENQAFLGVAYSPDGKLLYNSTGDTGNIDLYDTASWRKIGSISLNEGNGPQVFSRSFAAPLVLSADGNLLYVIDQANWRVAIIDTRHKAVVNSVATGVNPIALCLSPDGKRLFIANSGLFEYRPVSGVDPNHLLETGLQFPPFAYPSPRSRRDLRVNGHTVPGLGDENSPAGSSVWSYNIADVRRPQLISKLRLGQPVGTSPRGVVGGAAPSALVSSGTHVYVALAHDDAVAVLTPEAHALERTIALTPFTGAAYLDKQGRPLRGVMPSGLALHGSRLYVTEAGIDALAVIDTATGRLLGHIPVGWNPSAVIASQDGRTLYVINTKGRGTGPNAGPRFHGAKSYIGDLAFGGVSVIPANTPVDTDSVVRNNEAELRNNHPLPKLRHVFFIIRENRTFDEILGDLPGANGMPALARYGLHGSVQENPSLKNLKVTPNAHALATRFATSDNFYADSDVSADGHRWAVGIDPTPWMNIAWTSDYGGGRHENSFAKEPGRRALSGGTDAPMPEDEPEFGSLWEHVADAHLPLLNYGEGLEIEGSQEIDGAAPEGQRLVLNAPLPAPVFSSTDRAYPTFNLGIPDQFRFAEFQRDFSRRLERPELPALIVIRLPDDHTADPRPADGYPYRASYVADNDLALGKIVDLISHSKIWNDSAIFVTEDDAQGGVDHVDAHRSVLLVVSPYTKPGYISHRHTSIVSIQKTIYELLGLGPLNLEDSLTADLSDMFEETLHPASYRAKPADERVFNPKLARIARPKTKAEAAALLDCDDAKEIEREFQTRPPAPASKP